MYIRQLILFVGAVAIHFALPCFAAAPECLISGANSVCVNSTGHIYSAPPNMTGYAWSVTGRGAISGPSNGSNVIVNATTSGTLTINLTLTNGSAVTNCSRVVSVVAKPTATVSGSDTICTGEQTTLQATLTGTAPWTLVWSDGFVQTNITTSPATRVASPWSNTTYTVTSVADALCSGTASGSASTTVRTAPVVTLNPTDRTVCPGATVTLNSIAVGNSPTVRWQVSTNGGMTWTNLWPIVDASKTNYTFTASKADDGKWYRARFFNDCGTTTNEPVLLRVGTAATQLTDQNVCPGQNVTFATVASGFGPFRYQWRKDNTPIPGATNSILTVTNVSAASTGLYSVSVTGACDVVTRSAQLAMSTFVSATPLTNLLRFAGSIAIFNGVGLTGGPFTYQWSKDGTNLFGETNKTLIITNVAFEHMGNYSVIVSSSCGSATNSASLGVAGCFAALDVMMVIDRTGSMSGQAYADARNAATNFVRNLRLGATNDQLGLVSYNPTAVLNQTMTTNGIAVEQAINSIGPATNGTCIACGITAGQAELESSRRRPDALPVMVLLSDGVPNDFDTPSNALYHALQAKYAGTRVFTIGLGAVDHDLMAGMASSTNDYFYTSDSSGLAGLFDAISEIICRPPTNIFGPFSTTVCAGTNVTLEVNASGCASFAFQWRKDGAPLAGQTNSALILNSVRDTNSGVYSVIVDGSCRRVTNSAVLVVNEPALVLSPPANQASYIGSNAVFSVNATGTGLTYEWTFNGSILGTNSTLTLNQLTSNDAGTYCVSINGAACGGATNVCATLTLINRAPFATNDFYTTDEDVTLTVVSIGVLANDFDLDGDPLSAAILDQPLHGIVTLNPNGSFTYNPALNFNGTDTFTYRADDGAAQSEVTLVTIVVQPRNDTPVAVADDQYATAEDTMLTVSFSAGVLANDIDVDGDALTALLVATTTNGTLALQPNGTFAYLPNSHFNGVDHFIYRATDGNATSGVAVVTITVIPVNDMPVAQDDSYGTDEDVPLVVVAPGILTNDSDADGDVMIPTTLTGPTNGTLALNANGSFTYSPATNWHGTDSFTYRVSDGTTNSGTATVTITVNSVNDIPVVANDDQYVTAEDTALEVPAAIGVLVNDIDVDGDVLNALLVSNTTNGVVTLASNGGFVYLPGTNFHGVDHFTYRVTDGVATSGVAVVTITVTTVNDIPVAHDDSYSTDEDVLLVINVPGVLANDGDNDGDALSTVLVATTTQGQLTLNPNGSLTYLPSTNFHGSDSFTYRANDGTTNSDVAVVTITVRSVNDTPVAANDDLYTTAEDIVLNLTAAAGVLSNDVDVDGDALSTVLVSSPTNGILTLNPNGSFAYRPNTNFHGIDRFTYRATDGIATSTVAVVTITVLPVNDVPIARDDNYATDEDVVLVITAPGVLGNDSDVDGDVLNTVLVTSPTRGTLTLNANGSFTYAPGTNLHGVDSFTYRANDGKTNSAIATVTITVRSINDTPVAANDDQYATLEDTLLTVAANRGVLTNDIDVDGDTLSALLVNTTTNGSLALQPNGAFTYLPGTNFHGVDHFTYRATDGTATSGVALVRIVVASTNDTPVARDDSYATDEDVVLVIGAPGVLGNDSDNDGDVLNTLLVTTTTNGSLTLNANGSFTYVPATNFNGTDSFTYRARDLLTNSGIAVVTITVRSINDTPVAANDDQYTTAEDTLLSVASVAGVLANDIDVDGDVLRTILITTTTNGTLTLQTNGSFQYLPNTNFHSLDYFTYRATDGLATSAVATVKITVTSVNDVPVARDDSYATDEDMQLVIAAPGVLVNDSDFDGDVLTPTVLTTTTNGVLTLNPNGSFTYRPATNFHGNDAFTYRVSDGKTNSGVATVSLTIRSVNDRPVAVNDDQYSTLEDTLLTVSPAIGVLINDSDVDGDGLKALLGSSTTNGVLVLNTNGAFTYLPGTNFHGVDHFTYQVTDGFSTSDVAIVTINVQSVNDVPVARNDSYATAEDIVLMIGAPGVLGNDSDNDLDPLQTVLVATTTNGTLTLSANGSFTYRPGTNFHGTDAFSYRATDGAATSALAVVTIAITTVNDGPVAVNDSYTTDEDVPLTIGAPGVLANDSDQDNDALSTLLVSTTTQGALVLNGNGSFTYLPGTNFHGTDSFTYRATDGQTNSAVATVTITVRSVNDRPYSRDDGGESYSIVEDGTLAMPAPGILANDSDEDGDVLTAQLVTGPSRGALTLNANGSFTYKPQTNYFGTDTFTYAATDGLTSSAPSTVTIIVRPVNDVPSFVKGASQRVNFNAGVQTIANWATAIGTGPTNEASQALTFILSNDNPSLFSGQPAISSSGSLTYTPAGNNFGVATVTAILKDNGGTVDGGVDTSGAQTFSITLNGPPIVSIVSPPNDTVLIGTNNVTVVAEASDPDSSITNVQIFSGTNLVGSFTNGPFISFFANLPPRTTPYTFHAIAADDLNLRATSSVVSVTVTTSPPVSATGPIAPNHQNGLFEQYVRISNPTPRTFPNGMRLFITIDTSGGNRVWNATGTNGPNTFLIDTLQPLPSGSNINVLVQYYLPDERVVPNPILRAEPLPFTIPPTPAPQLAFGRTPDGRLVLQFSAATNRLYYIQGTTNLLQWKTHPGLLSGPGTARWTNQPSVSHEIYRALLLPY